MDADEAMSRETNEVEFMGLSGATATIDLEEPNSNTKGRKELPPRVVARRARDSNFCTSSQLNGLWL